MDDVEIRQRVVGLLMLMLEARDGDLTPGEENGQAALLMNDIGDIQVEFPLEAPPEALAGLVAEQYIGRITALTLAFCQAFMAVASVHDEDAKPDLASLDVLRQLALQWAAADE